MTRKRKTFKKGKRYAKRQRKKTIHKRQIRAKKKKLLAERAARRMLGLFDWSTYNPSTQYVTIEGK